MTALEILITSTSRSNAKTAGQTITTAMNILADYVKSNRLIDNKDQTVEQARQILNRAADVGYSSERMIILEGYNEGQRTQIYGGFETTIYKGLTIVGDSKTQLNLNRTTLDACILNGVKFQSIDESHLYVNKFLLIDFSSVDVVAQSLGFTPGHDTFKNCIYYLDSPPTGDGAHLIIPYLEARERPSNEIPSS